MQLTIDISWRRSLVLRSRQVLVTVLFVAALGAFLGQPPKASADLIYGGGGYSWASRSSDCDEGGLRRDPIGVIFRGSGATVNRIAGYTYIRPTTEFPYYYNLPVPGLIETHTKPVDDQADDAFGGAWLRRDPIPYFEHLDKYKSFDDDGVGHCNQQSAQVASRSALSKKDRFHVRLWQQTGHYRPGLFATVGTPHFDYWEPNCPGTTSVIDGNHRVPPHISQGFGSGYDFAREVLRREFASDLRPDGTHRYGLTVQNWANKQPVKQCGGFPDAHSNGQGIVIHVGRTG
jgi:hypothetical protein